MQVDDYGACGGFEIVVISPSEFVVSVGFVGFQQFFVVFVLSGFVYNLFFCLFFFCVFHSFLFVLFGFIRFYLFIFVLSIFICFCSNKYQIYGLDKERKKKDTGERAERENEDNGFFFAAFRSLLKFDEAPAEPRVPNVEVLISVYTSALISRSTDKLAPAALP